MNDDIRNAEFKLSDPTTWVDTKEEKARAQAREAFKQSVDRLETVLKDPKSTDDQIRAAIVDKQTALNLYSSARGTANQKNEGANYATPVAELYRKTVADPFHEQTEKVVAAIDDSALPEALKSAVKVPLEIIDKEVSFDFKGAIQTGQDALHSLTRPLIDAAEKSGAPAPLVAAATLPVHIVDNAIDFVAGVDKGVVSLVGGIGHAVTNPVDTTVGLYELGKRVHDATPGGRAMAFLSDAASGKYKSTDEALSALRDQLGPTSIVAAQYALGTDLVTGVFANSIKLWQEGKYSEAVGTLFGENIDVVVGVGALKVATATKVSHAAGAARVIKPAETAVTALRQRIDDFDQLYREAEVAQVELGRATKGIADATGGRAVVPPVKGRERALEKIATDYGGDAGGITDLARSSIEFDRLEDVYKALDHLGEDFNVLRVKDRFKTPTAEGYRDLLVNVETSSGHVAEIQLHLKPVLDVKNGVGHALYEEVRAIEAAAVKANRPLTAAELGKLDELRAQARLVYDRAFESAQRPVASAPIQGTSGGTGAATIAPTATGAAEAATGAPPVRPSWQTSEGTVSSELKQLGFKEQKSYLGGKEVPYGTPGSVRPDLSHQAFKLSVDVKNYDVASAKGRYRLVQDVVAQATKRFPNLPAGMRQGIVIDIRGQTISERLLDRLVDRIVKQSGGTIEPQNIFIQR